MKKLILALLSISMLVCSCKKNPVVADPTPEELPVAEKFPKIMFTASKHQVDLFEGSELKLAFKNEHNLDSYDSVKWHIADFYSYTGTASHFMISKTQVFSLPGNYKVTITGFKRGLAVEKDSVSINVNQTKDFLGINWKNAVDTVYNSFENNVQHYWLNLSYKTARHPHALLTFYAQEVKTDEEFETRKKEARSFFYNYITNLYGKSKFHFEGEDMAHASLSDAYNERFKTSLTGTNGVTAIPVAIWETQTSYIALLGKRDTLSDTNSYFYSVIAEPR